MIILECWMQKNILELFKFKNFKVEFFNSLKKKMKFMETSKSIKIKKF